MAIKNSISVFIDGNSVSAYTVLPLKIGNFLDERLDECQLSLRGVNKEYYAPLTPVEIVVKNYCYWGTKSAAPTEKTYHFIVANDSASEMQIGKGLYNHDLYLTEVTKIAECSAVDTLTFTNTLGRIYAQESDVLPTIRYNDMLTSANVIERTGNGYKIKTGVSAGNVYIPSFGQLNNFRWVDDDNRDGGGGTSTNYDQRNCIFVYKADDYKLRSEYKAKSIIEPSGNIIAEGTNGDRRGDTLNGIIVNLKADSYIVEYTYLLEKVIITSNNQGDILNKTEEIIGAYCCTYYFTVVENKLPLKKWTVTDVVNRLLDLAEPIRSDEKPRFKLNPEQADKFDKILAPELSFTKQTLRECLQEVGRVIHGEPRLEVKKDETGKYYYEVVFDMYASQEYSGISALRYIKKDVSHAVDSYATYLDSSAENLVNQLDKFSGVIAEPYKDGAKTVRTENLYVRITDGNMIIATQYPVYSVDKLEYVYTDNGAVKSVDITAWLFEKSIYDSQLSSYSESDYPYSKAYALYYSQGDKNIGGLNFKVPAAVFEAYRNYAIVNILKRAIGSDYELPGGKNPKYPEMCFRVTYTPIYNVRVAQTKAYYKDFKRPAALIYNQQSNVIESRSYGENLKGAIARLGNIEFTKTYMLARFVQIPQAGQKYNDDYYISVVAVEIMPTYIRCTIGLSKDFNRLSAYIGINSSKRYSEISQTQAVERNTLYREYVVIGDSETPDTDTVMDNGMLIDIAETFTQAFAEIGTGITPITNVCAWGTTKNGNVVNGAAVNLPVISSAFGNSVSFSWKYEDNYSAGPYAQYAQNGLDGSNDEVDGYFQNNVKYTDYYGRIYYYHFDLQMDGPEITADNLTDTALNLPKGSVPTASSGFASTVGKAPYVMRKDNREALQVNYQIDFVTNRKDIIIGSALASCCPAIRGSDATLKPKLYVVPTELNKFTDHIEGYEDVKLSELPSAEIQVTMQDGYFVVECESFPASGKSWAIVTAQTEVETTVENDDGEPVTQISFTGGDLLIGQNTEVISGQTLAPIYFTKKREIFDKTVWKDRR